MQHGRRGRGRGALRRSPCSRALADELRRRRRAAVTTAAPPAAPAARARRAPQFSNATNSSGIRFVHGVVNPTNSKAEMFGGGVAAATTMATATSICMSCAATSAPTCCIATTAETTSPTSPQRPASPTPIRPAAAICTAARLRRSRRRRGSRPVRRRHGGRPLPAVREQRRRHVPRRHRAVRPHDDGCAQHDLGIVRRLRSRRRSRHDARALGHAAAAGRQRRPRRHGIALAQRHATQAGSASRT